MNPPERQKLFTLRVACILLLLCGAHASAAAATRASRNWEKRILIGTIGGNYDVRITLRRRGRQLTGSYYHESSRLAFRDNASALFLTGNVDQNGRFSLVERETMGARGAPTGILKGRVGEVSTNGDFRLQLIGTWSRPKTNKSTPFVWIEERHELGKNTELSIENIEEKGDRFAAVARLPNLKGGKQADAFNAAVKALVLPRLKAFTEAVAAKTQKNVSKTGPVSLKVDFEITYADPRVMSVKFEGAVSEAVENFPEHFAEVLNYDLQLGQVLKLSDLFDPHAAYLELLAKQSARVFRWTRYVNVVNTLPASKAFQSWNLTRQGLLFSFDVPAAFGQKVEAIIPYDMFANMLAADGALSWRQQQPTAPKPVAE
ncbi:MAG: hypothetical protein WKF30_04590 [Pyrinomonadaceae bacterium]